MSIDKIVKLIKDLMKNKFFGKITIIFEHGKIVRIVKEESVKEL